MIFFFFPLRGFDDKNAFSVDDKRRLTFLCLTVVKSKLETKTVRFRVTFISFAVKLIFPLIVFFVVWSFISLQELVLFACLFFLKFNFSVVFWL